ncbi:flexible cuticle protein 12-like [Vespula maculifrons]|uniref:Flexible cuticle protein 12-like n=1 Tax=Vespula maculifrons TaxID=7453 RepID=A0ABD2ARN2_VESMC
MSLIIDYEIKDDLEYEGGLTQRSKAKQTRFYHRWTNARRIALAVHRGASRMHPGQKQASTRGSSDQMNLGGHREWGDASIAIFRLYKGRCTAYPWYHVSSFNTQVIILATLLVASLAAPQGNPNDITIVKQEEVNNIGVGGYHFSYEQSDGQKRDETAELRNEGTDDEELAVTGSFSFISPDGHTYRVDYTADKDGFHPNIQLVSK